MKKIATLKLIKLRVLAFINFLFITPTEQKQKLKKKERKSKRRYCELCEL